MTDLGGQPPKYMTPEQLEAAVEEFFNNPPTMTVKVKDGVEHVPKITITGLCLHLGFESRQSFYDYEKRSGFSYIIKRARLRIEQAYEGYLTSGSQVAGPIFALKNLGWRDNIDTHHSGHVDVSSMTPEQLSDRAAQLLRKMQEEDHATEEGQLPQDDQQ